MRELRTELTDIAIIDYHFETGGVDLVAALRKADERMPLVALCDQSTHEEALRKGADHCLSKPVDAQALVIVLQRATQAQRSRRRSMAIRALEHRRDIDPFVGESTAVRELYELAQRVLDSHAPVLVTGETGTGKGVLASWLHHHGPRAEEAIVDINCAGLSREFLESELFGHERGAFTGANAPKLGLLDVAHRGTAFLDEIGEMDLQLQPRLLKVLEEKRFRRIGDVRDRAVDIRLIAATNRDLEKRSRDGTFRADLYYRINTVSIAMPALRTRRDDIPLLARQIANSLGHDIDFTPDAIRAMQAYEWPGNIRELRNVIERAILISNRAPRITPRDLRFQDKPETAPAAPIGEPGTLVDAERLHIVRTLEYEHGSIERTAARLGVSRSTLYHKLRRHGITLKSS